MKAVWCSTILVCLSLVICSRAVGAGLMSGALTVPSRADQMIRLYPGTPLNPGASVVEVPTSAVGQFVVTWGDQQPGEDFAKVTGFSGHYTSGPSDPLGLYTIDAPATTNDFRGRLTDIVESGGNLVSATLTIETTFGVTLSALGNATVFTINDPNSPAAEDHYSVFVGQLDAAWKPGEIFDSPPNTNIYANVPGVGQVAVGQSFNRQVIALPEPSATAMLAVGALGLIRRRSRREEARRSEGK